MCTQELASWVKAQLNNIPSEKRRKAALVYRKSAWIFFFSNFLQAVDNRFARESNKKTEK